MQQDADSCIPDHANSCATPYILSMEIHIAFTEGTPLRAALYEQLRQAILDGRIRSGQALPASRELARQLAVSRSTVEVVYERLAGEGYVVTRRGAGTFVSDAFAPAPKLRGRAGGAAVLTARPVWQQIPLSRAFADTVRYDFRTGLPDPTLFPHRSWRRLIASELRSATFASGVYAHPAGHAGLREGLARHLGTSRGVRAAADDVVITNGAQQALDIIARTLLEPGDVVAMEDPGYLPPRRIFDSLGARVVGVPVDRQGMMVDAVPLNARLVYVTPSHQYPLGVPLSLARRRALLALAERHDLAVIEDDYDSEFRFGDRPVETIHALDTNGRVIYVGSFSKTLLPTLRLGFLVAPASIRDAIHRAKYVTDWHTSLLPQAALARFIDEGGFARHLRRLRTIYRDRHAELVRAVREELRDALELWPATNGLHVGAVARAADAAEVSHWADRAIAAGVGLHRLGMFKVDREPPPGFALAYGAIPAGEIAAGVRLLRQCRPPAQEKRNAVL